jgi:hypothetical protein
MQSSFTVNAEKIPDYYVKLLTMPWWRIYTLNVDDLAEKVFDRNASSRRVVSVSATSGNVADIQDSNLAVIHLNGGLLDVPNRVTFGRQQYANRGGTDPFYLMLRHDLLSRPVVFIGTSLEEGQFWQHLEMRAVGEPHATRELRPRSYLVTPNLNKTKEALLSRYKVAHLPVDTAEFHDQMIARLESARTLGNKFLAERAQSGGRRGRALLRISDVPMSERTQSEYLMGAEPTWADAREGRIAERDCFRELQATIDGHLSASHVSGFVIVTGTAGTGKSSAMRLVALRLESKGIPCGWVDGTERIELAHLREVLKSETGLRVLLISDADLYDRRLSRMIKDAMELNQRLVVVCECRSSRVDRILDKVELGRITATEFPIPYLNDSDIDALLDVLSRENRLGFLKGKTVDQQRQVFLAEAGRQLLVAMYKATHGRDFKEKVVDEWNALSDTQRFITGIVAVAHAHRFYLNKSEIAIAFGDEIQEWPPELDALVRRKVILEGSLDTYRARHREIAQFIYDEMVQKGVASDVISALIRISATKMSVNSDRASRTGRMLSVFINHRLLKRTVQVAAAREIYASFEQLLAWDYHYWLHRGALELEAGRLDLAEIFLRTAKGIEPSDVFVDNELAYLMFKKANAAPREAGSADLVREAVRMLEAISIQRPDQRAHIYHIMGAQGLLWVQQS